jgi:hypothetical protein
VRFHVLPHTLNEALPLIYMWEIHEPGGTLVGRYVGKAKAGAKRPRTHYKRNVANILLSKPYRKGSPAGYRRIHQALAEAEAKDHQVTLQFLCNIEPHENINEIEQKYIRAYNCAGSEAWQLNA